MGNRGTTPHVLHVERQEGRWPRRARGGRSAALPAGQHALRLLVIGLALSLACTPSASAQLGDEQAKATHLLNFSRYTEWPESALPHPDEPMVFCFIGEQPSPLIPAMAGKTSHSRRVLTRQVSDVEPLALCHVLFIPAASAALIPDLLAEVRDLPVLTVSDAEGFLERGGIIALRRIGDRLRFDANQEAATRAGLKLSSTLLGLAHTVRRRQGEPR
jgi:hypothetical protein